MKQRTRAGLPQLHVKDENILAARGAGMSLSLTATIGWPHVLHAGRWSMRD